MIVCAHARTLVTAKDRLEIVATQLGGRKADQNALVKLAKTVGKTMGKEVSLNTRALKRRLSDASGFGRFVGVLALVNVAVWASAGVTSLWVGREALRRFREGGGVSELRRRGEAVAAVAA